MQTPLRKIKIENELTIVQVANTINCDAGNLSRLERGTQSASLELAEKLARFYKGKISEIQILYPQRFIKIKFITIITERCGIPSGDRITLC